MERSQRLEQRWRSIGSRAGEGMRPETRSGMKLVEAGRSTETETGRSTESKAETEVRRSTALIGVSLLIGKCKGLGLPFWPES